MSTTQLAVDELTHPSAPAESPLSTTSDGFTWRAGALRLDFAFDRDRPVTLTGISRNVGARLDPKADLGLVHVDEAETSHCSQPLVELNITGDGRARNTTRFTNTGVGSRLRYAERSSDSVDGVQTMTVTQVDAATGLQVTTTFTAAADLAAARVRTSVRNAGPEPVVVEMVTSFATGALVYPGESTKDVHLVSGTGEQLAENRWTSRPVWSQTGLADFNSAFMNQPGRGGVETIGTSTWSTARALPTGALENQTSGRTLIWQIEHNGAWRWEVDNVREGENSLALLLSGPEDLDHHWSEELAPGDSFTTVPVSVAVSPAGFTGALAELTRHRRWLRGERTADRDSLLVFNDYMNTLNGDPTTERLLPLIAAAAEAGAECFCIDAGWYDDTELGDWFPTVGEWTPSTRRFPDGGLARVTAEIRAAGMKIGLWVEPEVVGVLSPVASQLPDAAFIQRHGRRVSEHQRFFLDLRHPAARNHLDSTFDRLIAEFGVEFFKLDYNVTPGPGTDYDAFSVGAGLLGHNRAHLRWMADLRRRHPHVIFENCSSGAMRADFAMLEQFDFQSTSDQEDFRLYPWIAAGAPVQMLPEQAGNWAYAQAWMSDEEIAYTMTTGLSGRLYLSGFWDKMSAPQLSLVKDAVSIFTDIRDHTAQSVPSWPLGFPQWFDDACALTLTSPQRTLVYVWHRGGEDTELTLDLGEQVRPEDFVEVYPRRLGSWDVKGSASGLVLKPGRAGTSARVYEWVRS